MFFGDKRVTTDSSFHGDKSFKYVGLFFAIYSNGAGFTRIVMNIKDKHFLVQGTTALVIQSNNLL